ncbi:MAG TPA: hypothetical protein DEB12_07715 [Porphyromonadaceae bacterium]|jgi:aminoglycoside 3-N-acetyltransferase|nr:hypothetical protein [Porphyromonadaceae bacterium]
MKQAISRIYNKIALTSPKVEVLLRKMYWHNIDTLSTLSPYNNNRINRSGELHFEDVLDFLSKNGVGEGSNMVVHSSYGNLKPISLTPKDIVQKLIEFIGENGTLAMPVIRRFEEDTLSLKDHLEDKIKEIECTYDLKKTKVTSGILGATLMRLPGSVTSKFPLNPLTAFGPLADPMMHNNLEGELPSAHGPNSSWKFCADRDAWVVYLGVDFGHHLTMQQVAAECNSNWDIEDFYVERKFKIIDETTSISKVVKERRLKWTMFLAEKNVRKELLKEGIVKKTNINDAPACVLKASELIEFYNNHKEKYYPYYV